jgi:DNA-binding NarL/FixJ family response regulator
MTGDSPATTTDGTTRVLVADDHAAFRAGLRTLLETDRELIVVGEAETGEIAVAETRRLHPDVVLMDVNMPGLDGVEATRRIVASAPHVAVLMLTMHDDDETVFAAVRAGARGYLLKGARRTDLLRAVRAVAAGEAIFGPAVARRLMAYFARPAPRPDPVAFPELTEREREILDMVAAGRSNSDITAELVLAPKTVRNHVSSIFSKLQVRDRSEAIVRAREAGMGGDDRHPA